jgi:hypothetical protein
MKIEKALTVARRILEETNLDSVTISVNGKPSEVQLELGDYIVEKTMAKLHTIKAEEEVKSMACYRDTGVILQ